MIQRHLRAVALQQSEVMNRCVLFPALRGFVWVTADVFLTSAVWDCAVRLHHQFPVETDVINTLERSAFVCSVARLLALPQKHLHITNRY